MTTHRAGLGNGDSLTAAANNNNAGCHCDGVSVEKTGGMKGKKLWDGNQKREREDGGGREECAR